MNHTRLCFAILVLAFSLFSCSSVCPAVKPGVNPLTFKFAADAKANGKIKAFVSAAKDVGRISMEVEGRATAACRRMGMDLGLAPVHMKPKDGPGGAAAGACEAVAMRLRGLLQGGIRISVQVQLPRCQAIMQAQAECAAGCDVNTDAECRASCQARANVNASCTPAVVKVTATAGAQVAGKLVQTLQANLPELLYAQIALGQRLIGDIKTLVQVGAALPKVVANAGLQGAACIAAAAEMSASASFRVQASVRASASVSGSVGAG